MSKNAYGVAIAPLSLPRSSKRQYLNQLYKWDSYTIITGRIDPTSSVSLPVARSIGCARSAEWLTPRDASGVLTAEWLAVPVRQWDRATAWAATGYGAARRADELCLFLLPTQGGRPTTGPGLVKNLCIWRKFIA